MQLKSAQIAHIPVRKRGILYERDTYYSKLFIWEGYNLKNALLVYLTCEGSVENTDYALRKYVSAKNARLSLEYLSAALIKKEVASEIIYQSISKFF